MSPPSREVYAREFLVGDARLKKPENQLKELDAYRRALYLDGFWHKSILYFYEELLSVYSGEVPPLYRVLNLATVYLILHPAQQAAFFLPLFLWEELKQTAENVMAQLNIMCSFINWNITLPPEAFMDYKNTLDEYVAAHGQAARWVAEELGVLLQRLLYTSQIRAIAGNEEFFIINLLATMGQDRNPNQLTPQAITALNVNNSITVITQRERETLEQWLRDHSLG
jgi:hypothetical protein